MADTIIEIDPSAVERGERIGLYWHDKAEALGALMARDGQNDPIKVRAGRKGGKPYILVAGLHRLEGAKRAGMATVKAIVVQGDDLQLRLIEASENMHRRDFGPIEKALFVRALADVYEAQFTRDFGGASAQEIGARKRWEAERDLVQNGAGKLAEIEGDCSADTMSGLYGWQVKAAEALGMSSRTLRRHLFIHRAIIAPFPDLYEDLARRKIAENREPIEQLAGITDVGDRGRVIECIINTERDITVREAMAASGVKDEPVKAPQVGQSKFMDRAVSSLDRLSESGWRQFAPSLAASIKPSALRDVRDAIDARLAQMEGGDA